ncbi:hypothetical protein [Mycolicibacterium komossense]|uniref:Uncharacterized protein n=1 Tax=Mycolicibacterium komossense TaxID=1779 RepID=A0ABT3C9D1_9MYCO|nr:hypothetical protein [Mycolicibacterium komossense]MCV7226087.1 hypothetical protein [Mycolicibacterium komossense]
MLTDELLARLRRHYIKPGEALPGGVFLPECGWNGPGGTRQVDALYAGFTTTSGRILIGHELKVSRADWLTELKTPGKSDDWADQCHEWWLVVNDPAIVRPGELPAGWGLMSPGRSKTRMDVHTVAERKPRTHAPSWDATRSIIARQDTLRAQAIGAGINAGIARERKEIEKNYQLRVAAEVARLTQYQPDAEALQLKLKDIELALGGPIDWDAEERGYIRRGEWVGLSELKLVADAVRAAGSVAAALENVVGRYANPVARTRTAVDELDNALQELRNASTKDSHGQA